MSTELEERIAHLTRMVEDLSDVVARQEKDITRLTHKVGLLIDREAERESAGSVVLGDERPPHY